MTQRGGEALTELGWLGSFTLQFSSIELDGATDPLHGPVGSVNSVSPKGAPSPPSSPSAVSCKARARAQTIPDTSCTPRRRGANAGAAASGRGSGKPVCRRPSVDAPLPPLTRLPTRPLAKIYAAGRTNPQATPVVPVATAMALCLVEAGNNGATAAQMAAWLADRFPFYAQPQQRTTATAADCNAQALAVVNRELSAHPGCFVIRGQQSPSAPASPSSATSPGHAWLSSPEAPLPAPVPTVTATVFGLSELHAASMHAMMRQKSPVRRKTQSAFPAGNRDITAPRPRARPGCRGKTTSSLMRRGSLSEDNGLLSDSSLTDGALSSDLDLDLLDGGGALPDVVDAILGSDWAAATEDILVVSVTAPGADHSSSYRHAHSSVDDADYLLGMDMEMVGHLDGVDVDMHDAITWVPSRACDGLPHGRESDHAAAFDAGSAFEDAVEQYLSVAAAKRELQQVLEQRPEYGNHLLLDEPWSALAWNAPIYGLTA